MSTTVFLQDRNGDEQSYSNIRGVSLAKDGSDLTDRRVFYDISETSDTLSADDLISEKSCYTRDGTKITGTIGTYSETEIIANGTLPTANKRCTSNIVINVPTSGGGTRPEGTTSLNFWSGTTFLYHYDVKPGSMMDAPPAPTPPQNKVFAGWVTGANCAMQQFPFSVPNTDTNLYAVFVNPDDMIVGVEGLAESSGDIYYTDGAACRNAPTLSTKGNKIEVVSSLDSLFPFSEIREETLQITTSVSGGRRAIDNKFIKFPKMYFLWKITDGHVDGVRIAKKQNISTWTFQDSTGNTQSTAISFSNGILSDAFRAGQRFSQEVDYVYIGKYEGGILTTTDILNTRRLVSWKNMTPATDQSRLSFNSCVRYYRGDYEGTGDVHPHTRDAEGDGYQQLDLSMWVLYNMLATIYLKNRNLSFNVFPGHVSGDILNTGSAGLGATGSDEIPKTGWNTQNGAIQILGVENPYGNVGQWLEATNISQDSSVTVMRGSDAFPNVQTVGSLPAISGAIPTDYIKFLNAGAGNAQSYVFPAALGTTHSNFLGSYYSSQTSASMFYVGGNCNSDQGQYAGLWSIFLERAGALSPFIGSRLCYRPRPDTN